MDSELEQLISFCIKQDRKAESALYKYCFTKLMPICHKYYKSKDDSVEQLNKSYLKILNNLSKFDKNKSFDAWIKTITVNTIIDEFRLNNKRNALFIDKDYEEAALNYHSFNLNEAEAKLTADDIQVQIQKLPDSSKMVFNLFTVDGYSHKEIGEMLGINEGTSKWHLNNARKILKKKLIDMFPQLKEREKQA
ncbi:MAG: RNA polymerase sigma factor [Bacteroidia bacterium]|nr:RNA polymerase sigma factor [Bacteroidia bacterium]